MIKVSVMYPGRAGARFDMTYYLNTHIPLVQRRLGAALKGAGVDQGIAGEEPGSAPHFVAMAHLLFESVESFQASFGANAREILADVPNYTNLEPILQINEVKLS